MKKLRALAFLGLLGAATIALAQGQMNWNNTASTLISDAAIGGPMPVRVSPETTYYFGLFVAPYGTPAPLPGAAGLNDLNWQNVVAYTMNSTAAPGAGRMQNPGEATVPALGMPISFVIRGWQSYSGGADWEAAKPGLYNYGQSDLGFVTPLGDALPTPFAFGTAYNPPWTKQIGGFIIGIPEPTTVALLGLGAVACLLFRCRRCALSNSHVSIQFDIL